MGCLHAHVVVVVGLGRKAPTSDLQGLTIALHLQQSALHRARGVQGVQHACAQRSASPHACLADKMRRVGAWFAVTDSTARRNCET